jgi:diketogulonate reductase-like aldo/keto reductase
MIRRNSFSVENMEEVLLIATIKPVVNQIQLHPNVLKKQTPIIEFAKKHHIVIEAYSPNAPLRDEQPTPVVKVAEDIAARLQVKSEQVLMAWSKVKG